MRQILADPLPELLEQRASGENPCSFVDYDQAISAFIDGRISHDDILRATTAYRRGRPLNPDLLEAVRTAV
ncbi:hypothetical protein [Paraburkholderia nemoris]|uniref:hypothetical protein n=1 Tax=Paraburkholderia nemoris TaxID=2793076 RepID=UPI001B8C215E|nr:hypothetical protein [Paraburkholderia nemoris]